MLKVVRVKFGSDPEGFFQVGNRIVGSERLIPKKGYDTPFGKITRDGVQFELHPEPGTVPELRRNIGGLLIATNRLASDDEMSVNYNTLVEVLPEELRNLSHECRVLGCKPSHNIYGERPLTVDPQTYPKRSAAGHIHVDVNDEKLLQHRAAIIHAMDLLVGNTCVLLDRDPGAAERRENYGRAGECRFPAHGAEYRTISSFWLRDPALMTFVFGLANMAVSFVGDYALGDGSYWKALCARVNVERVRAAIDTNNFELALHNLNDIAPVLRDSLPAGRSFVLDGERLGDFVQMARTIEKQNGLDKLFPLKGLVNRWRKLDRTDLLMWL